MDITQQNISPELKLKITEAIKTRSSLEMLLQTENFIGTPASINELLHILQEVMGNRMMLEFIFSAHIAIWNEYREMITEEMWSSLAESSNFTSDHYTLLATSLIYKGSEDLGKKFLEIATTKAFNTKTYITVADAVHTHLKDNVWAEKILLDAAEHCSDVEHYSQIAESLVTIAEDTKMSRTMFEKAVSLSTISHEFMEIATAIVRTLKDTQWASEVFEKHSSVPDSGTPIEMLAEEAFHDELKLLE